MTIAFRHPITAQVDDRANFLRRLLKEYPTYLKDWEDNTEKEFAQIANETSCGDKEIENDIFSSLCTTFNNDDYKMNMFYQAIFLMCYSYYESCIFKLNKEANKKANKKDIIYDICKSQNIILSNDTIQAIDFMQHYINALRNDICHNNFGTFRNEPILEELTKKDIGVNYNTKSCELVISDPKFIEDTLDKMHMVLHELCEKMGYKTKMYPNDFK